MEVARLRLFSWPLLLPEVRWPSSSTNTPSLPNRVTATLCHVSRFTRSQCSLLTTHHSRGRIWKESFECEDWDRNFKEIRSGWLSGPGSEVGTVFNGKVEDSPKVLHTCSIINWLRFLFCFFLFWTTLYFLFWTSLYYFYFEPPCIFFIVNHSVFFYFELPYSSI